jgi:NAD(P)H dehydrogenase (quinone)
MYAVTGASGPFGRGVIRHLRAAVPAQQIVALVRDPAKVADLAAEGVVVRQADYNVPATLGPALEGVRRLVLVSGNEFGRRAAQHRAVIDAAKAAGVELLAYTSLLRADTSTLAPAGEHLETEAAIADAGIPAVLLRNGWYTENYLGRIEPALAHGVLVGASGTGRIASAARDDYAAAAAAVIVRDDQAGAVHELGGDASWTLADLTAELSRQTGRSIGYQDVPEAAFGQILVDAGLPEPMAHFYAVTETATARGDLDDATGTLGRLIGRPTTPLADSVAAALATAPAPAA